MLGTKSIDILRHTERLRKMSSTPQFNARQLAFQELFIGTLIYAVVLGSLNDYTSIVEAKSFSTILFAAVVLETLTYFVFKLKKSIVAFFKKHSGAQYKLATGLSVWLVMFLSKFVFIFSIDAIFGENITVNGFFGILAVALLVTVVHRLAYKIFEKLGNGVK